MEGRKGKNRHYPGRGFDAKYAGTYCERCRAEIFKGDRVAFGAGGMFGHYLCIAAVWAVGVADEHAQRTVDDEQARRRRARQKPMTGPQIRAMLGTERGRLLGTDRRTRGE
jgi:hypothetical protein